MFADRSDESLKAVWSDVPQEWRARAVFTDHLGAYQRFFSSEQHTACDKGSGLTSIVEAGTHARVGEYQVRRMLTFAVASTARPEGTRLVRKSCGVWEVIVTDLYERFLILVEQHNRERAAFWCKYKLTTRSIPWPPGGHLRLLVMRAGASPAR